MVNDCLFELGCEELPSGAVLPLANALAVHLIAGLEKKQIGFGEVQIFATPRRLAVLISQVQEEQPKQTVSRRGPAKKAAFDLEGKPTPALFGFAQSCQVTIDQLTVQKTDKGEWLVYETVNEGAKTSELLPELIKQALAQLPIPRLMRWGKGELEFARPVHWVILMLGEQVIPCELLGVTSGNVSFGHRFHHPQAIVINKPEHYESILKEAYVIADFSQRRTLIQQKVKELAEEKQAIALMPEALVEEVTSIVEWPEPILGNFEPKFLQVPAEALIASMQAHQKCFPLQNHSGELLPHFITVANINSTKVSQVILGNEKVMGARLSDADFFFTQDKKISLYERISATKQVVFQERLGSLFDKTKRMEKIMHYLASSLSLQPEQAGRAAQLSKCDLLTGMVGEFPELQGLMGYYYALQDEEAPMVAVALKEQYMPRFAADHLPDSSLGLALSLADRMDSLVGIFAIGQRPSGVKDPFKLRRHALAIVRMLSNCQAKINLSALISEALHSYGEPFTKENSLCTDLKSFILERLQSHYQSLGFPSDLISAVRARQDDWLYDFDQRIHALISFVQLPEAMSLSQACKRVNNLLQQAESDLASDAVIDKNLLREEAERALVDHLETMEKSIGSLYAQEEYSKILSQLARLREPVDAFFDKVMVMVEDKALKKNRLHLLARLQQLLQGVADIALLQL